jgi:hypothetical protein
MSYVLNKNYHFLNNLRLPVHSLKCICDCFTIFGMKLILKALIKNDLKITAKIVGGRKQALKVQK